MNKDQVKGGIKEAAGKAQGKAGELVGSEKQQAKGLAREAEGKVQKNYGDAKEKLAPDSGYWLTAYEDALPASQWQRLAAWLCQAPAPP